MPRSTIHQVLPATEFGGAAEIAFRLVEHGAALAPGAARLWLPGPGRAWQTATERNLPVERFDLPDIARASKAVSAWANLRAGWTWRRFRPGVVHLHSAELYGALPWGCALSGMRRVVHIHLEQQAETVRWAFRRLPELILTCANFLVENVRRYLPEPEQDAARIVAVPNCIDTERFRPGDKRAAKLVLGAAPEIPLAVMLANLAPHKGQETAIRAIALLKQQQVDVQCWLAGVERDGGGAYTAQLRTLIREMGVEDRVRLLGYRSDGPELLRAADFFLLPSTREGLPLSVLEAQATRTPVLAAPTAGIPEVVSDSKTGFLIPARDAEGYSQRIQELLQQPALRQTIVDQAFEQTQRKHRVDAYCRQVWNLYDELLGAAPGRRSRMAALV